MFYSFLVCYGVWCLWDKSWLWDIRHCWYDYPYHEMPSDIWCYYMMELAFYWSLSICQFFDVKRKDFLEMMIHHNATILLMMFSWSGHFFRIGSLVMILHDVADPLLELAKMFRYAKYRWRLKKATSSFHHFLLPFHDWLMTLFQNNLWFHICTVFPGLDYHKVSRTNVLCSENIVTFLWLQVWNISRTYSLFNSDWCCLLHWVLLCLLHLQWFAGHAADTASCLDILSHQGNTQGSGCWRHWRQEKW